MKVSFFAPILLLSAKLCLRFSIRFLYKINPPNITIITASTIKNTAVPENPLLPQRGGPLI